MIEGLFLHQILQADNRASYASDSTTSSTVFQANCRKNSTKSESRSEDGYDPISG